MPSLQPCRHTGQEYRTDTLYKHTVPMTLAPISQAIPPTMPTHKTRIPYRRTIQEYRADAPGINKPCHPPNRADKQNQHTLWTHYTRIPFLCPLQECMNFAPWRHASALCEIITFLQINCFFHCRAMPSHIMKSLLLHQRIAFSLKSK